MSNLSDRISYLRGLAEGLKVDESSSEGKLITQLIDVLSEVIDEVDDLHDEVDELNDYVESIDEDLSELEGDFDDDDDDDEDFDFDFDDEDDDEDLDDDDEDEDDEFDYFAREEDLDEDDEDGVGMYVGCICPECHGMFCIDARIDEDNLLYTCPHCNKSVEANPMDNDNVPIAKAALDNDTDE